MRNLVALVICLFLSSCTAKTSEEIFLERYKAAINSSGIPDNQQLVFDTELEAVSFNCPPLPDTFINTNPTSVHELTPYNIKVVGAVGDSVTAGFGAKAKYIWEALTEYRGVSWSIGGDDNYKEYITLPNLLKEFNPDIKGFSVKTGKATSPNAHFNQAVSGAVAENIPGQVRTLINKIKSDESINIEEDWKLITIWIGGNDLCAYCNEKDKKSPENYVKHIKEGLNELKAQLPRTFVNLVEILDVTKLADLDGGLLCEAVHLFACSCKRNADTSKASREYNKQLEEMIDEGDFDNSDDFTVVIQPFFKNVQLPEKDPKSYFGLDCFHFNTKGHREAAWSLWNNMLTAEGSKSENIDWENQTPLKCPTKEYPYFFTRKNLQTFFGAAPNPDPNSTPDSTPSNLLGIVLGSSLTAFVVAMAIFVGIIAVVYVRRQRRHYSSVRSVRVGMSMDTEKTRLMM